MEASSKPVGIIANALSYVATALQTEEVWQIIQLVLSIIGTIVLIVAKVWSMVKEAKRDGHISDQEKGEIIDTFLKGVLDLGADLHRGRKSDKVEVVTKDGASDSEDTIYHE